MTALQIFSLTLRTYIMALNTPPTRIADIGRVDELRLRLRMLRGEHEQDVQTALQGMFGLERAEHMKKAVDVAANSLKQIYTQLSALYNFAPRVDGPSQVVIDAVEDAGHWTAMIRNQRDTLALGDLALVLEEEDGQLQVRTVTPDLWYDFRPRRRNPKQLAYFAFWLQVGEAWELWEYQIEDAAGNPAPAHRVRQQNEVDVQAPGGTVLPTDANYAWKDPAGKAYLPVVLYHASDTGRVMDWSDGRDVTRGCIRLMVYYTDLGHAISESAWQQRFIIDGEINAGAEVDEQTGSQTVVADPATVLSVHSVGDKTAQCGAFPQSADPEALFRVTAMYARNVALIAGVRTPEATRNESDIRSGYSLAVSRESVAEQQAIYAPMFSRADRELLHVAALLLGQPSAGPRDWQVDYQAVELGPVELKARIDSINAMRGLGLISRRQSLFLLHPGWNARQVEAEEARIDADAAKTATPANTSPGSATPTGATTDPTPPQPPAEPAKAA